MPAENTSLPDQSSIEHTEDCPADRDDCTCGGYLPVAEVERLRKALEEIERMASERIERHVLLGPFAIRDIARDALTLDEKEAP